MCRNLQPQHALTYVRLLFQRGVTTPHRSQLQLNHVSVLTIVVPPRRRSPRSRHSSKEDASMYPYSIDELAWAVDRDREEEARQTRPHPEEKPTEVNSVISRRSS